MSIILWGAEKKNLMDRKKSPKLINLVKIECRELLGRFMGFGLTLLMLRY